jgi:hypothetical protein
VTHHVSSELTTFGQKTFKSDIMAVSRLRLLKAPFSKFAGGQLNFSTSSALGVLSKCQLHERSVIQLKGEETPDFLQGLVTNDINHLESDDPITVGR